MVAKQQQHLMTVWEFYADREGNYAREGRRKKVVNEIFFRTESCR